MSDSNADDIAALARHPEHPQDRESAEEQVEARESDNEGEDESAPPTLPSIMSRDDPRRMMLTREEQWNALDIKATIEEGHPEIDNLSDFWYAQLAIVCHDNVDDAVQRAQALQHFRQEYAIADTLSEGYRAIKDLVELFPGAFLSNYFNEEVGIHVLVHDHSKYETSSLKTPEKVRKWFVGLYYMSQSGAPDFESIRKGFLSMVECGHVRYSMKQDFKLMHEMFSQLLSVYPTNASLWHYNTGVVFNLMATMMKKALPRHLRDKFRVGLTTAGGMSLNDIFLVPNSDAAAERVLLGIQATLKKRAENESRFSLADDSLIFEDG